MRIGTIGLLLLLSALAIGDKGPSGEVVAELVDVDTARASNGSIYEAEIVRFHQYEPAYITVKPGTTIVWTNLDVAEHNVHVLTGKNNALSSDIISELVFPGETTAMAFYREGDYRYFCDPHPYMQGYVYVKAGD